MAQRDDVEAAKAEAARAALSEVRSGMRLGLGTGSTVFHFVAALGEALAGGRLSDLRAVPTSERTAEQARGLGIPLVPLEDLAPLDLCVDGADEIDPQLDLVKGLGAALLREKMVQTAARRFVVIADDSKLVQRLGQKAPLPIEVLSFAHAWHVAPLAERGLNAKLRRDASGELVLTDNGHPLLDAHAPDGFPDPAQLAAWLDARPGVVGHGLFLGSCARSYVATAGGVVITDRPSSADERGGSTR